MDFDEDGFRWGQVANKLHKGNVSYSSFFYNGEEYELYDNVCMDSENAAEPHVAKIVGLWEDKLLGRKRMLARWYFRPSQLANLHLEWNSKELFLAYGNGKGVLNENDVAVVTRKCKVLCTSKNPLNKRPSQRDLQEAEFSFDKIYDVDMMRLSSVDTVATKLGYQVVFNKPYWVLEEDGNESDDKITCTSNVLTGISKGSKKGNGKKGTSSIMARAKYRKQHGMLSGSAQGNTAYKKSSLIEKEGGRYIEGSKREASFPEDKDGRPEILQKKRKQPDGETASEKEKGRLQTSVKSHIVSSSLSAGQKRLRMDPREGFKTRLETEEKKVSSLKERLSAVALSSPRPINSSEVVEVEDDDVMYNAFETELGKDILTADNSLTALSLEIWEENLMCSISQGRVLRVGNIDLSLTSADILSVMKHFFEGCSDARLIPHESYPSLVAGEAFVVFHKKSFAESTLQKMEERCLVFDNNYRPLIATLAELPQCSIRRFPGHFPVPKISTTLTQHSESMNGKSGNSCFSSLSTLECGLAMDWRYLQEATQKCWTTLYQKQMYDREKLILKYK